MTELNPPTQPELSPDGKWKWENFRWVPVAGAQSPGEAPKDAGPLMGRNQLITLSAGTAFKIGFFGIMGAWVAAILPVVIVLILIAIGAASHSTR